MLSSIISSIFGFGRVLNKVVGHEDLSSLLSVLGIMSLALISVYLVTQLKSVGNLTKQTAIRLVKLDDRVTVVEHSTIKTQEQLEELEKVKDIIVKRGLDSVLKN